MQTVLASRQVTLLMDAAEHPAAEYTVASHAAGHGVVLQTARTDLQELEGRGLLARVRRGRANAWVPAPDLADRLGRR
ncbi:DeoR/GlpR family DNA-binding transcription regulator [Streptosporangium soli]|nr:hypothetical protein [Streptosporangium sp. KLBMP 9127]